ncbi:MAG: tetratricopeptide repeat protein [Candidatus Riflebacteria bacterium]|nr:tetratricopeptide repeat protein [Candidatus Riflebacteria bacterium]
MNKSILLRVFFCVFCCFPACICFGQNDGFNPPTSETSVRALLEGHQKAPKADTYYLIALSEARKGNNEAAFKAIKTGLAINSTNIRLLNLQGALLAREGKLVQARKIFMMVLNLSPEDDYAKTSLSTIEHSMQPVRKIEPVIKSPAIASIQEAPISPLNIQNDDKNQDKLLEAEYFLEVKIKQQCYHNMAIIKRAQDAMTAANPKEKDYTVQTLVEKRYLVSLPVCPKSGIYSRKDNDIVCDKHGTQTELGAEVTNVYSEFNNGMRSKLSRNYLDALKSFEQVVILYPKWGEAHFQLGDTLFRLGEADTALESLRTSLKHEPGNLDAELLLANIYFKKGMKTHALAILDRITEQNKGSVYAYAARSIAKSIRSGRSYYELFPPQ